MTNEEKAYEISQSPLIEDGIWHYATAEIAAIVMAEWKDQQFKEYLEREKAERERVKTEMIDKVCEWLRVRNVLTEDSIKGFRKAMEE